MVYIFIFLFIVLVVVWYIEARFFLFLFEYIFYKVDKSPSFRGDIEKIFPQHKKVIECQEHIVGELLAFISTGLVVPKAHEVDEYNASISSFNGPAWRTFYLKVYNAWFEQNASYFPKTVSLFKNMPGVTCVMFSILEPQNSIPPHKGMMKGIYRYQLPLIQSTTGECSITVNGDKKFYELGKPIVFDDNNIHTVSNYTDKCRAILFLDIQKPSSRLVRGLDNFFMKLVQFSPKFRKANVSARGLK